MLIWKLLWINQFFSAHTSKVMRFNYIRYAEVMWHRRPPLLICVYFFLFVMVASKLIILPLLPLFWCATNGKKWWLNFVFPLINSLIFISCAVLCCVHTVISVATTNGGKGLLIMLPWKKYELGPINYGQRTNLCTSNIACLYFCLVTAQRKRVVFVLLLYSQSVSVNHRNIIFLFYPLHPNP